MSEKRNISTLLDSNNPVDRVYGTLIGLGALLGILALVVRSTGIPVVSIGMLPFMLILGGVLFVGIVSILMKTPNEIITEIIVTAGIIVTIVVVILLFISHFCLRIYPVELFEDTPPTSSSFLDRLTKAEADVCKLVDETNNYIQADVGPPGISTPELVTVAQQKAVAAVPGPIVSCPPPSGDKESLTPVQRLERMEMTLSQFVEPEFKSACVKAGVCSAGEGFQDGSDGSDTDPVVLQRRLDAVNAKIKTLTVTYLDPMKKKQEDLQKGQASDSDKQKGAAASVVPSSSGP